MKPMALIRKAEVRDLDDLVELLRQLFAIEADFNFAVDTQRRGLEMLLARVEAICLVAEVNRQVVGMVTAQILISTAAGGKKALVEDVVVTEAMRGQGIGGMLLQALERWAMAQGIRRLDLLADRNNAPALGFYQRLEWRRTELIGLQKKLN